MYKTIAYDPEVNAPRVFGEGITEQESIGQCQQALREYLVESPAKAQRYQRWIKHVKHDDRSCLEGINWIRLDSGFLFRTINVS